MASKAQLAALAKARAARKKKPAAKKPARKNPVKPRKKAAPIVRDHVALVTISDGRKGYITSDAIKLDTELANALKLKSADMIVRAQMYFARYKSRLHSVEVMPVSKAKKSSGYGVNPVPASKALKQKEAAFLFEDFTGHKADHYENRTINLPDVGLKFGECTGIMYETVRDGVKERYCHEFKKTARPDLGASFDGKQIFLVGGNYRFTNRGIVDN